VTKQQESRLPIANCRRSMKNGDLARTSMDAPSTYAAAGTRDMDLLIIEDDNALGKAIHRGLSEAGHECRWVRSGQRGFEEATTQKFDAVILDLMLPDLS